MMSRFVKNVCRSLVFYGLFSCSLQAAQMSGRITNNVTGAGILDALIGLDLEPADGMPEIEQRTDPFGFYHLVDIPAGTYLLGAIHGGYTTHLDTNTFAAADNVKTNIGLTPVVPDGGFSIETDVRCVTTGARLFGVPVAAIRYITPSATNSLGTTVMVTDTNGRALFTGMTNGAYRFRVNDALDGTPLPKWASYTTVGTGDDKTVMTVDHAMLVRLKPDPLATLRFYVEGFDPKTEIPGPLSNVVVEIEGLDPFDYGSVLYPSRSGVTDTNGIVTFKRLPAIPWRIAPKHMAYAPTNLVIDVDFSGCLPTNELILAMELLPADLAVVLLSPYAHPDMMDGLPIILSGVANTLTEGIKRVLPAGDIGGAIGAIYMELYPGRYELQVGDPIMSPPVLALDDTLVSFTAHYKGRDVADVVLGMVTTNYLALNPTPATVRLRLFAADEIGKIKPMASGDAKELPIYGPKTQTGIQVWESMYGDFLVPEFKTNVVLATDGQGEVTFGILPGVYGFRIPTMSNYWGSNARYVDVFAGVELKQGWPFHQFWPFGVKDPKSQALGMPFDSGKEYLIDLFVRTQAVQIAGDVLGDTANPTTHQILANPVMSNEVTLFYSDEAQGGGMVMLASTNGTVAKSLAADNVSFGGGSVAEYRYEKLSSGIYTVTVTQARNTFNTNVLEIEAWNPPGVIPVVAPDDLSRYRPLRDITVETLSTFSGTNQVGLNVFEWNTNTMAYDVFPGSHEAQVIQPKDYATGLLFSAISPSYYMPVGEYKFWSGFGTNGWYIYTATGSVTRSVYIRGPSNNVVMDAPSNNYTLIVNPVSADDPGLVISNTSILFTDGMSVMAPSSNGSYSGSFTPMTVSNVQWSWLGGDDGLQF